jgi:integrase
MPPAKKRMHALTVEHTSKPGLHRDPETRGLYLKVTHDGTKSWVYRFMLNGRARAMGLGPFPVIKLAKARDLAIDARRLLIAGKDPIESRRDQQKQEQLEQAKKMPFKEFAEEFIESKKPEWTSKTHAHQWSQTMEKYVYPVFGDLSIPDVDVAAVLKVVRQQVDGGIFWQVHTPTASRVRERVEAILDAAKVRGLRDGENPAAWNGNLEHVLPSPSKIHEEEHHRSLHYDDVAAFMAALSERKGAVARAFEWLIYTATRSGETLGARWDEIDRENRVWTLHWKRVKRRKEEDGPLRIPLSDAALAVLDIQQAERRPDDDYVFPSAKNRRRPLSDQALQKMCKRTKIDATPHGFRASFKTWATEKTSAQHKTVEAALAHRSGKLERAYQRGDMFEKRRELMEAWGRFARHGAAPALLLAG